MSIPPALPPRQRCFVCLCVHSACLSWCQTRGRRENASKPSRLSWRAVPSAPTNLKNLARRLSAHLRRCSRLSRHREALTGIPLSMIPTTGLPQSAWLVLSSRLHRRASRACCCRGWAQTLPAWSGTRSRRSSLSLPRLSSRRLKGGKRYVRVVHTYCETICIFYSRARFLVYMLCLLLYGSRVQSF